MKPISDADSDAVDAALDYLARTQIDPFPVTGYLCDAIEVWRLFGVRFEG